MAIAKKITINDVALAAGVSVSTVSLVLSGKGRISSATGERVNQAIEQLGFVRNRQAASLRGGQSGVIGLIVSDLSKPFYAELTAGLTDALERQGKMVFLTQGGRSGEKMAQRFDTLAAQGVDVRLIYDDFGSLLGLPSDFVVQMERAHIRCIPFNPVVPLVSLVMNHRDHRKIVVVDGNTAYTGGINLADEYINEEERFGYWKDAALRTEGAAVWNFTVMFLDHWNAFRPSEEDYMSFMPQAVSLSAQSDGVIQPYGDSPLDEEALAETVYLNIINQAQRYVYIYTPYFAVGETMLEALKAAAKRGVDVRLVLPGIPDKKLVFRLTRSYYVPLLRAGVRIYEFTPGFLHAKCQAAVADIVFRNLQDLA
jgi:cardiolipin synthase